MVELTPSTLQGMLSEAEHVLALTSRLAVVHCVAPQITTLEKTVPQHLKHTPASAQLQSVEGMGTIVAQTIVLDTGAMGRCPSVGTDASYCRCVGSTTMSHGKRNGQGTGKNGHPSLAWASMEAAQCAIRCSPTVQRLYQRNQAKGPLMIARKAVAHQLARACYAMMRDLVPCEVHQACG